MPTAPHEHTAAADTSCFHCGTPIAQRAPYRFVHEGVERPLCCRGCLAVVQTIVAAGLDDYYRYRRALPESQAEGVPAFMQELLAFDEPAIQQRFVHREGAVSEATLLLEGISCAACVWLNERHLRSLPGVESVTINYAAKRANVRWRDDQIRLSAILQAVAAIGYRAYPYDPARLAEVRREENKSALKKLLIAGLGMMQVMMYAVPTYLAAGDMSADIEQLMRWVSLLLTLPVVGYSASGFFANAWRDLKLRRVSMDTPVALGIAVAFAGSVWATLSAQGEVYFDSIAMFVFFLLAARHWEARTRAAAMDAAHKLVKLMPAHAWRLPHYPASQLSERVAVTRLAPGDHVLVKPGEMVPADGVVVEGVSEVDESLLSGEAYPVAKRGGSPLTGGSGNAVSALIMRVQEVGADTVLASIVRLLDRALSERPRLSAAADRLASAVIVFTVIAALAAGAAWYFIAPERALWIAVAVLVVTCPCALALATPAALAAASARLARRGVLVTRAHALETLAQATHFVFDKTGTLTAGELELNSILTFGGRTPAAVLGVAAALERGAAHPVARALDVERHPELVRRYGLISIANVSDGRSVPGAGVEGMIDDRRYRLGTLEFVQGLHGQAVPEALRRADQSYTGVALGDERGWLAWLSFADLPRPESGAVIAQLQRAGMRTLLLSGDRTTVVAAIGKALGIATAIGAATPEKKLAVISDLQRDGAIVCMVGEGVNDAPVLGQAQVSIAVAEASQLAQASADILLLGTDLGAITYARDLACRTRRVIRQNLAWALGYNLIAIPAAMSGLLTPWLASVGMIASSMLVTLNAARLTRVPLTAAAPAVSRASGNYPALQRTP